MPSAGSKVRLKDIAETAGISVAAVSMALADHPSISEPTKVRIRILAQEMGYRPAGRGGGRARSDATQTCRLGFVSVGRRWDAGGGRAELLHAFSHVARESNARVEFISVEQGDSADVAREILAFARELDGVMITDLVKPDVLERIAISGTTFVVYGNVIDDGDSAVQEVGQFICVDDLRMARESTHMLLGRGHERIGFLCEKVTPGLSHARWLSGYRLALAEAGIQIDDELIFITDEIEAGHDRAAAHFLALVKPPTAFIVPDGRIASSLLRELENQKSPFPPQNIVVECTEQSAAMFGLSQCPTCHVDLTCVAAVAIHQLLELMDRPLGFSTVTLGPFKRRNWNST